MSDVAKTFQDLLSIAQDTCFNCSGDSRGGCSYYHYDANGDMDFDPKWNCPGCGCPECAKITAIKADATKVIDALRAFHIDIGHPQSRLLIDVLADK